MNKKKGIITLVVSVLALIAFTYVCVFGLDSGKTGSASNIKLGLDLAGGVSITYEVVGEEEPSAEDMSDTIYKLQKPRYIRKVPIVLILKSPVCPMPMQC